MTQLPEKPAAVAHVSDQHWEVALDTAAHKNHVKDWWQVAADFHPDCKRAVVDHARCLILLGEVPEPLDPIDAAIYALFEERTGADSRGDSAWHKARRDAFGTQCRKHFAGLTFPKEGSTL